MVKKILDESTGLTRNSNGEFVHGKARRERENLINRERRDKKKPGKKVFPFVTGWDPRLPDLRQAINLATDILYEDPVNEKLFPKGSIISGFRRGKKFRRDCLPYRNNQGTSSASTGSTTALWLCGPSWQWVKTLWAQDLPDSQKSCQD